MASSRIARAHSRARPHTRSPASAQDRAAATKVLLAHRCDVEACDNKKNTALLRAAQHGTAGVLVLLLEAGASTTCRNVDGQLAVDRAREGEHQNVLGLCGKQRPVRPAGQNLPANWQKLARGWLRLEAALSLIWRGRGVLEEGGRFGRSLWVAVSHTGARPAHGARPQLGWRAASRVPVPTV